jgi:hypothetical protein
MHWRLALARIVNRLATSWQVTWAGMSKGSDASTNNRPWLPVKALVVGLLACSPDMIE